MKFNHKYSLTILTVIGGLAMAANASDFLESKTKEWFASSRPISQTPFVTDAKGCLYGLVDGPKGPALVAMLAKDKTPLCQAK